jgi:hypothetical protein
MLAADACLAEVTDGERAWTPQHVPGHVDEAVVILLPGCGLENLTLFHVGQNGVVHNSNEQVVRMQIWRGSATLCNLQESMT